MFFSGFWPASACSSQQKGVTTGTVHRLYNISCPPLPDSIPEKFVFLRFYHAQFLLGTLANYKCIPGYLFPDKVSTRISLG